MNAAAPSAAIELPCPLCRQAGSVLFHRDRLRQYRLCPTCELIFVPAADWLPAAAEKARYDLHRNDPDDPAYRNFLARLFVPLQQRLAAGAAGLDFGCGPGPAMAAMLREAGHPVDLYDPFYAPDATVWEKQYDFIVASEVFEHLCQPGQELERLWTRLKPGGWLGVLTQPRLDTHRFATWSYIRDPTHVAFFAPRTLAWLANHWQAEMIQADRDVTLFRHP